MRIFTVGICPFPPVRGLSPARVPVPAQTHISEKTLAAVPGAEGHVSGIQTGFLVVVCVLLLCFFFFFKFLSWLARREGASSSPTRQPAGITCLKKEGGVGGDFGGAAGRAVRVLGFAEQVADLSFLHGSHPDVPCLDYLT